MPGGDALSDALPALPPAPGPRLRGTHKAAVLMAGLGSERAASVLQRMRDEEIESLSLEMASLSSVGPETADSVFSELATVTSKGESSVAGGLDFASEVIERALGPERAAELLGRLSTGTGTRPLEFLKRIPPERIAALVHNESPQTIALILTSLNTSLAAHVLARLPGDQQADIGLRIARMGVASSRVIEQVEEVVRQKLKAAVQQEYSATGGSKTLADILNHADRSTERNVLDSLAGTDQALADEVRGMLFVFEDIVNLEERSIQQILREVDQKDLVLALRGADETIVEVVMTNMSERGAAMLKEEMEIQQPQRKKDIDEAQSRIVAVVRKLEESGAIIIAGGDEEGEAQDVV